MENPLASTFSQIIRVMEAINTATTSREVHARSNLRWPEHKIETYMRMMANRKLIEFDTVSRQYSLRRAPVVQVPDQVKKNRKRKWRVGKIEWVKYA